MKTKIADIFIVIIFCLFVFGIVAGFFTGCSKPIYKVQTKEVLIPIKCNLKLPQKPQENGSFESHKALAIYFQKIEQIAKDCTQ